MPVKLANLYPTRRSIIAAASALAASFAGSNLARADAASDSLPDAADAMTKIMPVTGPALTFTTPRGKQLTTKNYEGHVLLVNLWATWCGPCVEELPSFAALAKTLPPNIKILPISIDLNGAVAVTPFYADHGITDLPILLDPNGNNMDLLGTNSIPLTLIYNQAGQITAHLSGAANWNTPAMIAYLQSLLPDAAAPTAQRI